MFYSLFVKEIPEPFPLPTEAIVKATAGWAHCVSVTGKLNFLIADLIKNPILCD